MGRDRSRAGRAVEKSVQIGGVNGKTNPYPTREQASAAARDLWRVSRAAKPPQHLIPTPFLSKGWGPPHTLDGNPRHVRVFRDTPDDAEYSTDVALYMKIEPPEPEEPEVPYWMKPDPNAKGCLVALAMAAIGLCSVCAWFIV